MDKLQSLEGTLFLITKGNRKTLVTVGQGVKEHRILRTKKLRDTEYSVIERLDEEQIEELKRKDYSKRVGDNFIRTISHIIKNLRYQPNNI